MFSKGVDASGSCVSSYKISAFMLKMTVPTSSAIATIGGEAELSAIS